MLASMMFFSSSYMTCIRQSMHQSAIAEWCGHRPQITTTKLSPAACMEPRLCARERASLGKAAGNRFSPAQAQQLRCVTRRSLQTQICFCSMCVLWIVCSSNKHSEWYKDVVDF